MALTTRIPVVLREEPQFRLFFAGQALSMLGDRITFIAIPFAVLSIGGSATQVGLVAGAQTVPFALLSLAAGVWADRVDRRAIMIASDVVRLLCQLIAGTLLVTGQAEIWHLAAIGAVFGAADAFFSPSMVGLLPQVVSMGHLQQANALRGLTMSSGLVVGPAVGGVLIAVLGVGSALLVDAATFAISIACLLRVRPRVAERLTEPEPNFLSGLRNGWHEVRARSWVMAFLASMIVYHLVVLPSVFVLGPVISDRDLGGPSAWALIVAAFGVGAVIGDLILLRWRPSRPLRVSSMLLIVASCQAAIIGSGMPLAAIAGLELLTGIAVTGYFTLWETSLQEHIPEHAISRVSSYDFTLSVGLMPIGFALVGPVADSLGLQTTVIMMSATGICAALACLCVPSVRGLSRPPSMPRPSARPAPAPAAPPRRRGRSDP